MQKGNVPLIILFRGDWNIDRSLKSTFLHFILECGLGEEWQQTTDGACLLMEDHISLRFTRHHQLDGQTHKSLTNVGKGQNLRSFLQRRAC